MNGYTQRRSPLSNVVRLRRNLNLNLNCPTVSSSTTKQRLRASAAFSVGNDHNHSSLGSPASRPRLPRHCTAIPDALSTAASASKGLDIMNERQASRKHGHSRRPNRTFEGFSSLLRPRHPYNMQQSVYSSKLSSHPGTPLAAPARQMLDHVCTI